VAKAERGKPRVILEPSDLAELVKETLEGNMDRLRASGFMVAFTACDRLVDVYADKEAVIRILVNLLSNAEKYSNEVKDISVTVSIDDKKNRALVSVADRGIGVPRAHRSRIFKEFHRVDSTLTAEKSGTGLGLSIARSLARSLGGDVRYAQRESSDYAQGSVFTLSLPIVGKKDGNA
jgi:two-component system, OmpR family, phosphate regulon sensor histidine kinase PhoR